ncbi:type II secretion system F family protein [Sediminibacillus dalangtanensis]|uniref:Type II secretion system F family protein n=1 Tax=Sediminibacillus dalangtanensis TaxID=2729421 RepID=A0ABX7VSQ0_9BACI|nr:type II secretion system F family protein [Sediminibacillus dalangtanensis]QTM99966.1 type II secretion system F family protein [Sediminibacillus dalangtanensis]
MAYYRYQGRSKEGKAKTGKVSAESKQEALSYLRSEGVVAYELVELNSILYKDIHFGRQVKNRDFVLFLRQFATLIDAGISLVAATGILAEQSDNKYLKAALEHVKEDLETGVPLTDAMEKYPKIFPELLVSMVHAGEISGSLDEILDNMASYYEKQYRLKQKITSSLAYPLAVGSISILVSIFLLVFIVPIFTDMFASFGEEIPAYTAVVLRISSLAQGYWWLIVILAVLLSVLYQYLSRKAHIANRLDRAKLKLPLFGKFLQKALLARMTQTLSSLLASSVPILQAISITERVIGNQVFKQVLKDSQASLEEGESLAGPMKDHWAFPKLVTQMIAVGESSGSLDSMLKKVADFYEQELDEASDKLKSLIEPVMIVFLAVMVGAIVLAIIIPMFAIFENI